MYIHRFMVRSSTYMHVSSSFSKHKVSCSIFDITKALLADSTSIFLASVDDTACLLACCDIGSSGGGGGVALPTFVDLLLRQRDRDG